MEEQWRTQYIFTSKNASMHLSRKGRYELEKLGDKRIPGTPSTVRLSTTPNLIRWIIKPFLLSFFSFRHPFTVVKKHNERVVLEYLLGYKI